MHLIPIRTPVIQSGDDLASVIAGYAEILDGDVVIVSSKAIATAEGAAIKLDTLKISEEAHMWSRKTGCGGAFMQAVLDETARLHGTVVGHCRGALLTEVRPDGLKTGTIFAPNAGMDLSNVDTGYAIGWPHDAIESVKTLHMKFTMADQKIEDPTPKIQRNHNAQITTHSVAVIVSDSCCRPRRLGVTAFALAVAGMNPFKSEIGQPDLFGKEMRLTVESVADQLATAGNTVMGNAAQSIPAAIIRDHGFPFSDFCGWVDGIEPDEDLFSAIL